MSEPKYAYTICGYAVVDFEVVGIKAGQVAAWSPNHEHNQIFIYREDEVFYTKEEANAALKEFLKEEKDSLIAKYEYDMELINGCLKDLKNYGKKTTRKKNI